jgi:hypothetical protein
LVRGDGVTDYEERIASNIAEHGWFCVSVLGDATRPPFSYSVGFAETLNAPEFIVLGMSGKMGHGMLWELFRALKSGAPAPGDGDRVAGILSGYDCIARKVHPDNVVRDYFNSAIWRWGDPTLRGAPLQACQLLWPGLDGLFPWEPGCEPEVRAVQPLLFEPPRPKGLAARFRKLLNR